MLICIANATRVRISAKMPKAGLIQFSFRKELFIVGNGSFLVKIHALEKVGAVNNLANTLLLRE